MPTKTSKIMNSVGLKDELLIQAEAEFYNDRRSEKRFPFFRSVTVEVDDHNYMAFTREISDTGIGLLHSMKLPLTEVVITMAGRPDHQMCLLIERCESIGAGWYISGGRPVVGSLCS
jgi:hypothetical protein